MARARSTPTPELDEFWTREFASYERAVRAGNIGALLSALVDCIRKDLPPPRWLLVQAYSRLIDATTKRPTRKRGRTANPFAQFRQDMIHYARWDVVQEVRDKQVELAETVEQLRGLKGAPARAMLKERERLHQWLGRSLPDAYRCAHALLLGTEAHASESTIEYSYKRVERLGKDPAAGPRFKLPKDEVLRDLGLKHVFEDRKGRKLMQLIGPELKR
jgi:hypothetical protein